MNAVRNHDRYHRHAAIRVANRIAGSVAKVQIEVSRPVTKTDDVVPASRRHVAARRAQRNLNVVDDDLHHAPHLARAQQHFHPCQVPVIARQCHRRLHPRRAVDQRHHVVVLRLIVDRPAGVRTLLSITPHQHVRRHELHAPKSPRDVVRAVDLKHAAPLAGSARVVARRVRRRGIQVADAASFPSRIAATEEWRVGAPRAPINAFPPLRRIAGEHPRTALLDADLRQQHALKIQPVVERKPQR